MLRPYSKIGPPQTAAPTITGLPQFTGLKTCHYNGWHTLAGGGGQRGLGGTGFVDDGSAN
jgi:hypothetical protein